MRKIFCGGLVAACFALALPASTGTAAVEDCGLTTLEGTVTANAEEGGALECGPGEPLVVRKLMTKAKPGREARRTPLLSFVTIADVQLADEESPLRGEWADKCESHPATSAFRPHETMVPYLFNAHILAANEIISRGSPVLDDDVDFAFELGDLADNNQYNELRWIIDISDGDQLVDPDSGDDGYDGVQSVDPEGAPSAEPLVSPVEGMSLLDVANQPFWAAGFRAKGKKLPWYTLPGNHDVKVQGTIPNTEEWRTLANQYAQGSVKVADMGPDQQQEACQDPNGFFTDPDFLTNPGTTRMVPPDENRRLLSREEWVQEHFETSGVPKGHGYNHKRCTDAEGELLYRACYSFKRGPFHFINLDTNPDEGLESGNVDDPQFQWLKRELKSSSKKFYGPGGKLRRHKKAKRNRLIIVATHHTITSTDNEDTEGAHNGEELAALLLRFPNLIMQINGHTHQNKIWAHRDKEKKTGFWEVNTSAIADYPHQSRTVEIANNHDGTLSFFAVIFDAAVAPNARSLDWVADDPTSEIDLAGADANTNEDWLASAGREVGFYDPQADLTKIGTPKDRNVELLIKLPFKLGRGR